MRVSSVFRQCLATCLLSCLAAGPALLPLLPGLAPRAYAADEPFVTDYYEVTLPDNWQKLQYTNGETLDIAVLATKSRDCILTTINGRSGGASVKTITQCFAQQYQATRTPSVKGKMGSFVFKDATGEDGTAYVTVQDQTYMVVTVSGNQRKGRSLVKAFSSAAFPDLLPSL